MANRDTKAFWAGYVDIQISEQANKLRRQKGWTKTMLIEKAIKALLEKYADEGVLQSAGISPVRPEPPEGMEYTKTKSGRQAIRLEEEVSL